MALSLSEYKFKKKNGIPIPWNELLPFLLSLIPLIGKGTKKQDIENLKVAVEILQEFDVKQEQRYEVQEMKFKRLEEKHDELQRQIDNFVSLIKEKSGN